MSWAEVRKINSDFANEPLNFNNYINDISTFKENSYVLDMQNQGLWRDLISNSLTLFGHSAIHEVVYNRLTDADVDYMLLNNGRLGESFNSFYAVSDFMVGGIDAVLKGITTTAYNKLELKFQNAINRYISDMTSSSSAGTWLGTVFGISELKSKATIASILSDTTLWNNTIMANESLRYVVCLSAATINWFSSTNSDAFLSFITEVSNSTQATMDLFNALNANDKLTTFMSTENVVTIMANKKASMEAICYMVEPFAAMISSETAMNIVSNTETSINVIIDGITNAANSEAVLSGIKENLTKIEESLPTIANTETVIVEVSDTKEIITQTVSTLQKVTTRTDVLIANINALLNSEIAMVAFSLSDAALESITSNEVVMGAMASSEKAMVAMVASNKAMLAMYENAELITPILADSDVAYNAFYNASTEGTVYNTGAFTTGKTFLVCVRSQGTSPGYGYFITGNSTRGFSTPGDTETKAMLFASRLSCTAIGAGGVGARQWAKYIEISG